MSCPDPRTLERLLEGDLSPRRFGTVEKHLAAGCSACAATLARLRVERGLLIEACRDEADLEDFERRLARRLRQDGDGAGDRGPSG